MRGFDEPPRLAALGWFLAGSTFGCSDPARPGPPAASTTGAGETTSSAATATTVAGGGSSASGPSGDSAATTGVVSGDCGISVANYELSSAIGTVGIVTWSASSALDSATVEFGPSDSGFTLSAPVDLRQLDHRTLLLGMKGSREYSFQVVASSRGQACASPVYSLVTGPVSNSIPNIQQLRPNPEAATSTGFIVTSVGLGGLSGSTEAPVFIIDMDGDPVWWAPAPASCSRARMDWEGNNMWMQELNVDRSGGEMRRVSMDGLHTEYAVPGLNNTHHDFAVLPSGIVASLSWNGLAGDTSKSEPPSDLIERAPDGSLATIATLDSSFYQPGQPGFHANSLLWHEADQTYTVSDRHPSLYVKLTRTGELVWQFGGQDPVDPARYISGGDWQVNHGHHLLENGNLLLFSNRATGEDVRSPVIEYSLDTRGMTGTEVWRYAGETSNVLGDVQRLANGNTLITYSLAGIIQEVDPQQNLVQSYATDSLGYSMYRPTLYGPPPK